MVDDALPLIEGGDGPHVGVVELEVDDVEVATVVGGPLDEDTDEEVVEAAAAILVAAIQNLLEAGYRKKKYEEAIASFNEEIAGAAALIKELAGKSQGLKKIENKQNILCYQFLK